MPRFSKTEAALQLPCPVVILSASDGIKEGAMTATAVFVSENPSLISVSVSRRFATFPLIESSGTFAINILADNQLKLVGKFGSVHGFEVDKFARFGIKTEPGRKVNAPLIQGCYATIECRVKTALWEVESNRAIYIAEPLAFRMDPKLRPVVWLNGRFFEVGALCSLPR